MDEGGLSEGFRMFNLRDCALIPQLQRLGTRAVEEITIVGQVLPFRVNAYVLEHLIDWENAPNDPMYRLVFPSRDMLTPEDFEQVEAAFRSADFQRLQETVASVRLRLSPHPDDQMTLNVPIVNQEPAAGIQHKYSETVLFFPRNGQTCHSYCTYCFRWAQFVADDMFRFASKDRGELISYLECHPEVTDILFTGGDPLVMKTQLLARYLEPLLEGRFGNIKNIRIGTKALTYWPQRFLTDEDADDLLRLFEQVVTCGKSLALMAHFVHWRQVEAKLTIDAIHRIQRTGVVIRSQGPLLAHINDDSLVWQRMWESQVRLGIVPYYMFVCRNTGASRYFAVPLVQAAEIYGGAIQKVSGLGRTARGPVMSASPGKVEVQGVVQVGAERVFVLRLLQARNPSWVMQPFFARFSPTATWFDDLVPAFGSQRFFFEEDCLDDPSRISRKAGRGVAGVASVDLPGRNPHVP